MISDIPSSAALNPLEYKYCSSLEKAVPAFASNAELESTILSLLAIALLGNLTLAAHFSSSVNVFHIAVGTKLQVPYRVIYEINDGRLIVTVITIGHRREIYEQITTSPYDAVKISSPETQ